MRNSLRKIDKRSGFADEIDVRNMQQELNQRLNCLFQGEFHRFVPFELNPKLLYSATASSVPDLVGLSLE